MQFILVIKEVCFQFVKRFITEFFIISLFFLVTSCDLIKQHYEARTRANMNPYLNFYKSLDCNCDQKNIISPQIKIFKKTEVIKVSNEYEILSTHTLESQPDKNIFLKYNKNKCGILIFKKDDIVIIKGRIESENTNFIIEPFNGYIELNGKKHCLD